MTEEFFERKREWSRWKHRLLQRYLGHFSGIVGSAHPTVYYIDGFAGEGRYKDPPEDGSPVIAAKIAADAVAKGRGFTLRCINIEPDGYDELCASTAAFDPSLVENRKGTFADNLDSVLETIGKNPALFFLDPCGHKGMEWDVVMRIVERARVAITEVLLNFYITKIDIHGGYLRSTEKQAAKFVAGLDALFGTQEWRPIWDGTPIQEQRILKLTDLYMDRLTKAFAAASSHGITARYAVKTIDGNLKYFIMYGTRHPRGARAMSEAVFRVTMEYEDARAAAVQAALDSAPQQSLFEAESRPTEEAVDAAIVRDLIPAILALSPRQRRFKLADLEEALLTAWFGRAIEKHFRRACIQLIEEKKAQIVNPQPVATSKKKYRVVIGADTLIELL
ncbi:MAG TPA: three-Cys-motif partner protein TcmP [Thermoanaerobaculia bacterium]|nr:three-Cys-motif partner protein TcmP [Thermoanaerobaculia bacterium]